jgi:flagella basal body P-ring formation protein FlgA
MKIIIFIISLIIAMNSFGCSVSFHPKVLYSETQKILHGISFNNCSQETKNIISQRAFNSEGKTRVFYIIESLQKSVTESIQFEDNLTEFIPLEKTIIRTFMPSQINIKLTNLDNFFLDNNDQITTYSLFCLNCNKENPTDFVLKVTQKSGKLLEFPLNIQLVNSRKALKILKNIAPFTTTLDRSWFQEVEISEMGYSSPFSQINELEFYYPNKPLLAGEILKSSDLSANTLIRAGNKTEIILENEMIKIKTFGISRSNGILGQMIDVYHPEKKKSYQGKIIGLNKVVVTL